MICLTLSIVVLTSSMSGCLRNKKTAPGYGPSAAWIEDWREKIKESVDDPDKVTQLLQVINEMESLLIELDKEMREHYQTIALLDHDYATSRDVFEREIDEFAETREAYFHRLLDRMFEMKEIAGREDWPALADIDESLWEVWRRSPADTRLPGGTL